VSGPLTAQETIVRTMQYMSPEQLEGKDAARGATFFLRAMYIDGDGEKGVEAKSQASLIASI